MRILREDYREDPEDGVGDAGDGLPRLNLPGRRVRLTAVIQQPQRGRAGRSARTASIASRYFRSRDRDPVTTLWSFSEENDVPVLGLRDGSWLHIVGGTAAIGGVNGARLFARGLPPRELASSDDVSFLLTGAPRFDTRASGNL
jgi:hypothetical protein